MTTPGGMDYTCMPMEQQSEVMRREPDVGEALFAKATMWENAARELNEAAASVGSATDRVESGWTSGDGKLFVQRNRSGQATMGDWAGKIESSGVAAAYKALQQPIKDASTKVVGNTAAALNEIEKLKALAPPPPDLAERIQKIRDDTQAANAGLMRGLDAEYRAVIAKLDAAVSGRAWEEVRPNGPAATGPGGPAGGPAGPGVEQQQDGGAASGGEQSGGAEQGGEQPGAGASGPGVEGGADGGAGPEGGLPPGVDPSLSGGLGSAPFVPPNLPPSAIPPGVVPPAAGPGVTPFVPMGGLGAGAGLRGGGGGGGGGGIGAGVRYGASGPAQIPTSATPVSSAVPPTPGAAPAIPGVAAGGAGTTGGGGVPPMMPPVGGGMGAAAGAGGSGGPGGPGGNNRPRERKRDNDKTPGLPALLSGKAGMASSYAFSRNNRAAEWDTPATVQLIDEDLWQVEDKPAAVEQQAPVRRVRH